MSSDHLHINTIWVHTASGDRYRMLAIAQMQARDWCIYADYPDLRDSVDMEEVIVYQSLVDNRTWVRPIMEFVIRFEYLEVEE